MRNVRPVWSLFLDHTFMLVTLIYFGKNVALDLKHLTTCLSLEVTDDQRGLQLRLEFRSRGSTSAIEMKT